MDYDDGIPVLPVVEAKRKIPVLQPAQEPVGHCYLCGRPVWEGEFARREVRGGSFSTVWNFGADPVNYTAFQTLCNECTSELDRREDSYRQRSRQNANTWQTLGIALVTTIVLAVAVVIFLLFVLGTAK
jgi:hypothetical protein